MVSDWQVLTALHVVDCQSAIATIYVTNNKGKRWRFSPEKEWRGADISRIQMASADTFHRKISPPRLRLNHLTRYEPVYIQAGHPKREEVIGQSTGWSYGGNGYGEPLAGKFSYRDAATQPGNSGAGVYDREGQLVGIHVEHADGTKLGYASYVTEEMIPR
jgi:V8-like Glu-specific endopeptidase